uniref:Uncharacterized protein n=1 Tax=Romanomermis culicivorax TaxID=13658 RepID=A0A915L8Y2_ROMCU
MKLTYAQSDSKRDAALTLITHDMYEKATTAGLNQIEQVKKITLIADPFTVENGLITPTMKMKRIACAKRFAPEIVDMLNL